MSNTSDLALWVPSHRQIQATAVHRFASLVGRAPGLDLHDWSVANPEKFWSHVWDACGVIGERGDVVFDPGDDTVRGGRFFPNARLSFTENLLGHAPNLDGEAIVARQEDGSRRSMTWGELQAEVAATAAALRAEGVAPGERVAAWMPNVPETVVVMLATLAIGAVFTSTSPDFGTAGVLDRFGQVEPVVLVATDGYRYGGKAIELGDRLREVAAGLPTLRRVVVVANLDHDASVSMGVAYHDWLAPHRGAELSHERRPFDHPGFILYSSGTTGKPKCIVHRAAGILLMHLKEHQLHNDVRSGDRVFYFTTCGWMMFNWLVSALASGATIVLFDGSPQHPTTAALFDLAAQERCTLMGVSAKYIDSIRKAGLRPMDTHQLSELRTVCSTGSVLHADSFRYVYDSISSDVHLASISGGTDLCGCFVAGDPTQAVWAGEIQGPALGLDVTVLGESGQSIRVDEAGELVCRNAFPSVPLGFWGDDGARFQAAYFDRFPGVWTHGDFASLTVHGGFMIHGRSDATLNASGVRIGTAELYRVIELFDEVVEAVAVGQEWDNDTRIVLFVRPAPGYELTPELEARIRAAIRTNCSPRHVPARIASVSDVPRTRSGKVSELAVADVVNHRPVRNTEALANPEVLAEYADRAELAV